MTRTPNIEVAEGLHGALLIGPCHSVAESAEDWSRTLSTFEIDLKRDDTVVDHGRATNVPDGPVSARHHLVDILVREQVNPPLAAGEIVTAGTLTGALPVLAGETWTPEGSEFPAFYKEFLSMYGGGDFGSITVLSPDPRSQFPIWETTAQLEDREFNFIGVVDRDSDYFGFLIEQGVCANDIWMCDYEFGYEIGETDYTDFFDSFSFAGELTAMKAAAI